MRGLHVSLLAVLVGLPGCSQPAVPPTPTPASRPVLGRGPDVLPALALPSAPGAPGEISTWTSGGKEAVGTSAGTSSKLWFTLQGGVLTEVYYPKLDVPNVRSLELAVSDGREVWLESGLQRQIEWVEEKALVHRQTSRHPAGRFTLRKTTLTDPSRETLLIEVELESQEPLDVFVLYDPSLANTCGSDTGYRQGEALIAEEGKIATALVASPAFTRVSTGYQGKSDGRADLLANKRLTRLYDRADRGNILQVGQLPRAKRFTLALGFGAGAGAALKNTAASLAAGFPAVRAAYVREWAKYVGGLRVPVDPKWQRPFKLAAMVLHAHEDKTYRGAMIASMSIQWGTDVSAERPVGGYHLVWSRDLYQIATALIAMGDRPAAARALEYLFTVQRRPDGTYPQNSWLDGRDYWKTLQMDELAFPIVLAWQLGRNDKATWEKYIRASAEYLVKKGPGSPQERWEEEAGYSPSTIAAEIAGLVCAAEIARQNRAAADAARYLKTADRWAANLEKWLVTRTGTLDAKLPGKKGYYLRINDNDNPDDGHLLSLNNRGGDRDEREVVDAGFLELVRLGIRPPGDPIIERSLKVVDGVLMRQTPRGPCWYRYSHDGYGERPDGGGFNDGADGSTDKNYGIGRLWPLLTGERGEYELARGGDARPYLEALAAFANQGGMIPEQVWDRNEPSPRGFRLGDGTASATPLVWAEAQLIRLIFSIEDKKLVELPEVVAARYLKRRR